MTTTPEAASGSNASFLSGGGEMGRRMRGLDWASTPLGPPHAWPASLKAVLSACLNSPMLGTVLWGPELLFLYNDAYIPSLAERHPGALGRPVGQVWGDAWEQVAPAFHRAMQSGEGFSNTSVPIVMVRNGVEETTYWDFTAAPIRSDDGRVVGLLNQGVEITDRMRAHHALQRSEEELRVLNATLAARVASVAAERDQLWRVSRDPFVVCDTQGRWLSASPVWTEILGWTQDELLGRTSAWMEHPEDHGKTRDKVVDVALGEVMLAFTNRFLAKDGQYRTFSWTAIAEGDRLFCVARDVTAELARASELRHAQEALRQSQKMEAVGQLTGGLAHDFNNLLTGMLGNLELLQARISRGRLDELERLVAAAQGAGRRAASLTQRLLAFSRRQTLDSKPTDVNRLIAGMEDLLRRTVGPSSAIEVVAAADLWTANIDAGQLESALLNLCLNARDAMPDGGHLTIETRNKRLDERDARELDLPAGDYLAICVGDSGTGMTPETIERAFEPFYTTKPLGEGTGLGLSMVYGFARQSNGQVHISSQLGAGTTLCVYLPRHLGETPQDLDLPTGNTAESAKGETILLVDDEAIIRALLEEVLDDAGYAVISAGDGATALKILQSDTQLDMLITDVGLPGGMNGRQVADAACALRPGLQVLFITGYAEYAVVGEGHLQPGMALLTKPFTMDGVVAKVSSMLKGS